MLDLQAQLASFNLAPGTSVSSSLINGIEFTLAFLATGAERLVAAPLNPNYSQGEVEFYLQDTKSKLLLLPKGALKAGHPAVEAAKKTGGVDAVEIVFDPSGTGSVSLVRADGSQVGRKSQIRKPQDEDVALVLHTSGTTGRPKGVPLTHRNLYTTMGNIIGTYNLTPVDRTYLVMPLFHVHGLLCGLLATLLSGGSSAVTLPSSQRVSSGMNSRPTTATGTPPSHDSPVLLNSPLPNPVPKLRFIRSCSSALSPSTFHAIEKTFRHPCSRRTP